MDTLCFSFPPVVDAGCRVLVLGSMPGVASLRASQYYAHPQNAFWRVLYALWECGAPGDAYEKRLSLALDHRVAIWDVAMRCEREGSSDAAMREVVVNDFARFFEDNPRIHTVFFNGRQAHSLFERLAGGAAGKRPRVLLPSTSPAHTMPFVEKLAAWRSVRLAAEQE